MPTFSLAINGQKRSVDAPAEMQLLWALRDLSQVTGAKFGCGVSVFGACTIREVEEAVGACQVSITDASGKSFPRSKGPLRMAAIIVGKRSSRMGF